MHLIELDISNYKSLGKIKIFPEPFSVIIGPNASGKSNFANALSFLSEVYGLDLETAIRRKGGFENIALRRQSRSKSAVEFSLTMKGKVGELFGSLLRSDMNKSVEESGQSLVVKHSFSFKTFTQKINADFEVAWEELDVYFKNHNTGKTTKVLYYRREKNKFIKTYVTKSKSLIRNSSIAHHLVSADFLESFISPQKLAINNSIFNSIISINDLVRNWAVYQFNPNFLRHSGVPTPNPNLSENGENLPALIDWLAINEKDAWRDILTVMQSITPKLKNITTEYLHNKTLGVFFHEEGIGRPWNAEEVSDGTLMTLTMLCSIADPSKTLVLIEEPENSLHPWIIRTIIDNLIKTSKEKTILITTHSPVLIDMISPDQIWCLSKVNHISNLQKLSDLSPQLLEDWKEGKYRISEYLDAGLIPNIVPSSL